MYLSLRTDKSDEPIVGRDLERLTYAQSLELVKRFNRGHNCHQFTGVHVIVVEILMSRAENYFVTSSRKMSRQNRKFLDENRLNFRIFFTINLFKIIKNFFFLMKI